MRSVFLFFLALLLSPYALRGQDHLQPRSVLGTGALESYESALANLFKKGYQGTIPLRRTVSSVEVLFRMTWLPNNDLVFTGDGCFTCEVMSGIRMIGDSARFESFALTADTSVWRSGWKSGSEREKRWLQSKAQETVRVQETSTPIDSTLAVRMHRLWKDMLLCVRYPESVELFQKTKAIFSTFVIGLGEIAGSVADPEDGTNAALLTEIGHLLEHHSKATSEAKRTSLLKKLRDKSNRLDQRLANQGRCAAARARR